MSLDDGRATLTCMHSQQGSHNMAGGMTRGVKCQVWNGRADHHHRATRASSHASRCKMRW